MAKVRCIIGLALTTFLFFNNKAFSWNDEITHPDLTQYAAEKSVLGNDKGSYLNSVGFLKGLLETLRWEGANKYAIDWLREGGKREDGNNREVNHFHNPITNLGLWGTWRSAMLWMQDSTRQASWPYGSNVIPSNDVMQSLGLGTQSSNFPFEALSDWSWQTTRKYYYFALKSDTEAERQADFAKMFRGLGQQMHLLQDMSVPMHVRNNSHLFYGMIESRMTQTISSVSSLMRVVPNPIMPSSPPSNLINTLAPIRLFDTDTYIGTQPINIDDTSVGLSEWTNANFFSDDTIFSQDFPHPAKVNTNAQLIEVQAEDGVAGNRLYIKQNGQDYRLAAYSYVHDQVTTALEGWKYILDDPVYDDNLKFLLPRAVGYSAALLDYFFRGKLSVIHVPGGIKVKNLSTEEMTAYIDPLTNTPVGSLEIYYDTTTERRYLTGRLFYTGSGSNIEPKPLAPGETTDLIPFNSPQDNINPDRYIVVFRGKLGSEQGAVIGKVATVPIYYVKESQGQYGIYRMDRDGSSDTLIYTYPDAEAIPSKIAISPDGSTLAFATYPTANADNAVIQLLDLVTTPTTTLITFGDWPSWSPDGSRIVFERELSQNQFTDRQIFIYDVADGTETQLTNAVNNETYNARPSWSPDGSAIAYTKYITGTIDCPALYVISLMDTSGNPLGHLTCPTTGESERGSDEPAWSPDGQWVAFVKKKYADSTAQLYKVQRTGGAVVKLTDAPDDGSIDETTPDWSFDVRSLVVSSSRDGNYDIWLVNTQGGYLTNLTSTSADDVSFPAFGK